MLRRVAAAVTGAIVLGIAPVALGQDARVEPFTMEVSLGVGGFVDPTAPVPVTVDLTAAELLVGRVDVTSGGAVTRTNVEVPAAGVKQYRIEGAPPGARRNVSVELYRIGSDGGEERISSETIRVRTPRNELLVGVLGVDGIDTVLRSAQTDPVAREVIPVTVEPDLFGLGSGVLPYLVVGDGAFDGLGADGEAVVDRWVRRGGRLYGPAATVVAIADPAAGTPWAETSAVVARHGAGEVGAIDPGAATPEEWSRLLRGVPPVGLVRNETFNSLPFTLVTAASAGREAGVPALPWLLGGIGLFVVLVGPTNFVALRRLGRPELAWLTVPVLSAVFVAGFWVVGRAQLQAFTVSQASVVIDDEGRSEGYGGFVLQVESGGDHELLFPAGWSAQPAAGAGGAAAQLLASDGERSGVTFELEDLGVGTTQAQWTEPQSVALDVALVDSALPDNVGVAREASVVNTGEWSYWAWGMVVNGLGYTAQDPLPPGGDGTVAIRIAGARVLYEPVIAETMNRRAFSIEEFDPNDFTRVNALAAYAEGQVPDLRGSGVFFFGFTDSPQPALSVDGRRAEAAGTTLVVKRLELEGADAVSLGFVRPELLDVVGAASVEGFYDEIYAYGADEVLFRYLVPEGVERAEISPGFTRLQVAEAFRWDTGEFEPISWGVDFALEPYVNPGGELVVRGTSEDDFFDDTLTLARYQLTWSTA